MGFSDLGCCGGEIQTPNLDRLAGNGLLFTQFYNAARCCPTRASLLTGLYEKQTGIGHMEWDAGMDGYTGDLHQNCVTIPEVLKQGGYAAYSTGKWHLSKNMGYWTTTDKHHLGKSQHSWPLQRGFDRFYGVITGCTDYYNPNTLVDGNTPIKAEEQDYYFTDAISDTMVKYIEEHALNTPGKPFFSYVAYTAPHWPMQAPTEDIAKYRGRYNQGWNILQQARYKRQLEMGVIHPNWRLPSIEMEYFYYDENPDKIRPDWEDIEFKNWHARRMEVYAAMIDRMDQGIGRIIAALERTNQLDNTLILFLSDNGACAHEMPRLVTGATIFRNDRTRDGRPIKMGDNPDVMPGPDDTYQTIGYWWPAASDTPFRKYKAWVHEGGIATPLIAHWPREINRRGELEHKAVGHIIDIMATCVDITGITYPENFNGHDIIPKEGISLLPVFRGNHFERGPLFWEHEDNAAVRDGKWKLVRSNIQTLGWKPEDKIWNRSSPGPWELYDMENDRTETNNIAKKYPKEVVKMAHMWESWAKRVGVKPWNEIYRKLIEGWET
jgi:arylsulfatase